MLEIRLLGELDVKRDGHAVPLPASRKSRALLAYLAATARPHLRERLCELLWDGPDDPRAALRWSIAKLRPLVDPHLVASRERIEFCSEGADVDIQRLCIPATATTDALEECAALYRGEFLEALDLPACFRFQQWCAGERERFRQLHVAVLAELGQRYGATEAALTHARKRIAIDPFNEQAHAGLIRLLASLGHNQEAMQQYEHCCQIFQRELASRPGAAVEDARRTIGKPPARIATTYIAPAVGTRFVGRSREVAKILSATRPVLIVGEPGIGKSRLIDEVRARTTGPSLYGRTFAAEMVRPYGVWADALGDFPAQSDRSHLFAAVAEMVADAKLIAIDDLQWIDEASAALLHYVIRKASARVVVGARVGEIDDNPHAKRLLQEIAVEQIDLGPLSEEETRALVSDERAAKESGGNPLFALELARSPESAGGAISSVIGRRLQILDGPAREVVSWAAAIGRQFDAEVVGRASGMSAGEMLAALEKLERSAIVRASDNSRYDFTHDLIRDGAYHMISGPRRTLVHRHIARALREAYDADGALAGEIMHHSFLASDHEDAARAAVTAGERCLRMFAYVEAMNVARRGLQLTMSAEVQMKLFHVIVMARVPLRERLEFSGCIAELTEMARRTGLKAAASLGAHLLACLNEESNDYSRAADATLQSAEFSRGDRATEAQAIANSARCLLFLQRDIDHAEELLAEAEKLGIGSAELSLAQGFLHAHRGRSADAVPRLEEAFAIAERENDHWREWIALSRLVTLALEDGHPRLALQHCARLRSVTTKMVGGSECVRSDVLECVARYAAGESNEIDSAIARLKEVDSKSDLAWALCYLAAVDSDPARARRLATEALEAAEAVGRHSEAVIARCILGLPVKPTRDITARAKKFIEERRHGRSRARTNV